MALDVPNRAHDQRRKVNFYDAQQNYTHTADVRWLGPKGYRSGKPHGADLKKHMEPMGGWADAEHDNNPGAPKTSLQEAGEAMDKAYSSHHDTFSWDNPHHYANNLKY